MASEARDMADSKKGWKFGFKSKDQNSIVRKKVSDTLDISLDGNECSLIEIINHPLSSEDSFVVPMIVDRRFRKEMSGVRWFAVPIEDSTDLTLTVSGVTFAHRQLETPLILKKRSHVRVDLVPMSANDYGDMVYIYDVVLQGSPYRLSIPNIYHINGDMYDFRTDNLISESEYLKNKNFYDETMKTIFKKSSKRRLKFLSSKKSFKNKTLEERAFLKYSVSSTKVLNRFVKAKIVIFSKTVLKDCSKILTAIANCSSSDELPAIRRSFNVLKKEVDLSMDWIPEKYRYDNSIEEMMLDVEARVLNLGECFLDLGSSNC